MVSRLRANAPALAHLAGASRRQNGQRWPFLTLLLAALLAGCAGPEVRYVSVPLDCPARPELPTVSREELACLPPEAHARLVWRETLRRQHAEVLEALCWSTHEGANAPLTAHLKGAE